MPKQKIINKEKFEILKQILKMQLSIVFLLNRLNESKLIPDRIFRIKVKKILNDCERWLEEDEKR